MSDQIVGPRHAADGHAGQHAPGRQRSRKRSWAGGEATRNLQPWPWRLKVTRDL